MIDIRSSFIEADDRFDEGYEAGREAGYDDGYSDGHDDGLAEAAAHPVIATDHEHFIAGYRMGVLDTKRLPQTTYQEGYDDGYEAGQETYIAEGYDDKD